MNDFVLKFSRDIMIALAILCCFAIYYANSNSKIDTSESCCYNPPLDTGNCRNNDAALDTSEVCI